MDIRSLKQQSDLSYDIAVAKRNALEKANSSFAKAQEFSWTNCANETLSFLNKVATYHLD